MYATETLALTTFTQTICICNLPQLYIYHINLIYSYIFPCSINSDSNCYYLSLYCRQNNHLKKKPYPGLNLTHYIHVFQYNTQIPLFVVAISLH